MTTVVHGIRLCACVAVTVYEIYATYSTRIYLVTVQALPIIYHSLVIRILKCRFAQSVQYALLWWITYFPPKILAKFRLHFAQLFWLESLKWLWRPRTGHTHWWHETITETVLTINLIQHKKISLVPFLIILAGFTLDGFKNQFSNHLTVTIPLGFPQPKSIFRVVNEL